MKRRILTLVACLGLLMASGWLVTNPAWAGSYTIDCADGSSRTCSGTHCAGNDDGAGVRGYCQCSSADGSITTKYCPLRNVAAMEEGPVN
ncbi:MAG TPA: hypothetical protein VFZ44_02445 [Pyrinomonadaceae bacterium]